MQRMGRGDSPLSLHLRKNMEIEPGQKFGRWIVQGRSHIRAQHFECVCKCGVRRLVFGPSLTRGQSKSCGCFKSEVTAQRNKDMSKHGHSANGVTSPTYYSWVNMITRCSNPNTKDYCYWGGKGIKVCGRWKDFRNFLADMGERPEGLTLDRINGNEDYKPGNCRWATRLEQTLNRCV